jgi:hypothetical protein
MFKKVKPTTVASVFTTLVFPHCDQRILHAPEECKYCDMQPEWQELRQAWGIAFTGYEPEDKELPCPADYARGDAHKQWPGNRPSKKELHGG